METDKSTKYTSAIIVLGSLFYLSVFIAMFNCIRIPFLKKGSSSTVIERHFYIDCLFYLPRVLWN